MRVARHVVGQPARFERRAVRTDIHRPEVAVLGDEAERDRAARRQRHAVRRSRRRAERPPLRCRAACRRPRSRGARGGRCLRGSCRPSKSTDRPGANAGSAPPGATVTRLHRAHPRTSMVQISFVHPPCETMKTMWRPSCDQDGRAVAAGRLADMRQLAAARSVPPHQPQHGLRRHSARVGREDQLVAARRPRRVRSELDDLLRHAAGRLARSRCRRACASGTRSTGRPATTPAACSARRLSSARISALPLASPTRYSSRLPVASDA